MTEADARVREPFLQSREAAQLELVLLGGKELEDAAALDDLAFEAHDALDVVRRELSVREDGLRDDAARLIERESGERLHEAMHVVAGQVDLHRLARLHRVDDAADRLAPLRLVGQLQIETDGERVEVARQLERLAGDDDRRARVRHLLRQLAQRARDFRLREVRREVLEQVHRVAGHLFDVLEHAQRVLGIADREAVTAPEAGRDRPLEERQLQVGRDLGGDRADALLLHRLDGDEGVEGADQALEIVHRLAVGH